MPEEPTPPQAEDLTQRYNDVADCFLKQYKAELEELDKRRDELLALWEGMVPKPRRDDGKITYQAVNKRTAVSLPMAYHKCQTILLALMPAINKMLKNAKLEYGRCDKKRLLNGVLLSVILPGNRLHETVSHLHKYLEMFTTRTLSALPDANTRLIDAQLGLGKLAGFGPNVDVSQEGAKSVASKYFSVDRSRDYVPEQAEGVSDSSPPLNKAGGDKDIKDRFTFLRGQVLFDGTSLEIPTGRCFNILDKLVKNYGLVVSYDSLDDNSSNPSNHASEQLRGNISTLNATLKDSNVPCYIDYKKTEGYFITSSPAT